MASWLLPEHFADILPRQARSLERISRNTIDLLTSYGFDLVEPPLVEYVDSLLTGSASDLSRNTFKFTDQYDAGLLGLRADMTPQIARIDAHILGRRGVNRLCYKGFVVHQTPSHPLASRQPYVVGAELFGSRGLRTDLEVIRLSVKVARCAGVNDMHLDIGHVGLVRAILKEEKLDADAMEVLLEALRLKDRVRLDRIKDQLSGEGYQALLTLMQTFGAVEVLDELREKLPARAGVLEALDEVETLAREAGAPHVSVDFCDVHGYGYLTGVSFAGYVEGLPQPVLRGGRYDDIGIAFGCARPAVGFTLYLREIISIEYHPLPEAIVAPAEECESLAQAIEALRAEGHIVVQPLPGEEVEDLKSSFKIDRALVRLDSQWVVQTTEFRK